LTSTVEKKREKKRERRRGSSGRDTEERERRDEYK